jgi:hypothetical protein
MLMGDIRVVYAKQEPSFAKRSMLNLAKQTGRAYYMGAGESHEWTRVERENATLSMHGVMGVKAVGGANVYGEKPSRKPAIWYRNANGRG